MNWLLLASDGIEAADVGIDDGEKSSSSSSDDELSPKGARLLPALAFERITYVHIHQCDDFSVRLGYRRRRFTTSWLSAR
jgi:plant cysteine oxidase